MHLMQNKNEVLFGVKEVLLKLIYLEDGVFVTNTNINIIVHACFLGSFRFYRSVYELSADKSLVE
jgi:hypothetical protein